MGKQDGPYKRFRDIPQFVQWGSYSVDVSWLQLEDTLQQIAAGQDFQMDPDFQRAHVWTEPQQISYVEFVMRGGRSSLNILWNCPDWPNVRPGAAMVLVDGKQRLQAARRFMADDLPVFGRKLSEYEDGLRPLRTRFMFYINGLKTRAEVLQWYLDLNRGGTIHTDDEIEKVRKLLAAESASTLPDKEGN